MFYLVVSGQLVGAVLTCVHHVTLDSGDGTNRDNVEYITDKPFFNKGRANIGMQLSCW